MKYLSFIALIVLTISGCNPYLRNNSTYKMCQSADCFNNGLIDMTTIDTSAHDRTIDEFLSSVDTTSRSTDSIGTMLSKSSATLVRHLNKAILQDTGKVFFTLIISPIGKCSVKCIKDPKTLDTSRIAEVFDSVKSVIGDFPESPNLWTSRRFSVQNDSITPDSVNTFSDQGVGRSKASIIKVVMHYLPNLRYLYNRRLAADLNISGKITVKFAINHYGRVIFIKVVNSTANDPILEEAVCKQVRAWKFLPILAERDITEVVYPFVFSR